MSRFGIGNFARGGEYLIIDDGTCIAHSKSFRMAKRIVLALADDEGCDADLNPILVPEATYYEDESEIPFWPRLRFSEHKDQMGSFAHLIGRGRRDEIEIATRVADQVIRAAYVSSMLHSKDKPEARRLAAICSVDTRARLAWGDK